MAIDRLHSIWHIICARRAQACLYHPGPLTFITVMKNPADRHRAKIGIRMNNNVIKRQFYACFCFAFDIANKCDCKYIYNHMCIICVCVCVSPILLFKNRNHFWFLSAAFGFIKLLRSLLETNSLQVCSRISFLFAIIVHFLLFKNMILYYLLHCINAANFSSQSQIICVCIRVILCMQFVMF